jgi:HSP20 family molecular chaperone IbpA
MRELTKLFRELDHDPFFSAFNLLNLKNYDYNYNTFKYETEEKDGKLAIDIFVPGIKKEELEVKLTGKNVLTVKTKKEAKKTYNGSLKIRDSYKLAGTPKLVDGVLKVEFESIPEKSDLLQIE